jgi:hypothetical protein
MADVLVPKNNLEDPEDRFGFSIFVKALHYIFRMDEGMIIEHENKKYVLHKFKDEETGEELIGIQEGEEDVKEIPHGTMLWLDLEKPKEERHKDDEPR